MLHCFNTTATDTAELGHYDGVDGGSLPSVLIPASRVEDFQDFTAAGWPEFGECEVPCMEFESTVSRILTCPPAAAVVKMEAGETLASVPTSSASAREKLKKRRANKKLKAKVGVAGGESRDKRVKQSEEEDEESNMTERNSTKNRGTNPSKNNSAVQKSEYIHVRARRGQATDSHSLAERARRERISKRMQYLQNLVPGCNKIAGKAGMLDEIINYVRSLQQQVEYLSMKLAALNPILDFSTLDNQLAKQEVFPTSHIPVPDASVMESACFSFQSQLQASSTWDADFQSLCHLTFEPGEPSPDFLSHPIFRSE